MIFTHTQKQHFSHLYDKKLHVLLSVYFRMASCADLERTIAMQRRQIHSMNLERNWLEEDNNIQRVNVIQMREKIQEYERYIQAREESVASEGTI